jgi:hypothetical protein
MRDNGIVRGEKEHAVPVVIGTDTVYIHDDIHEYDKFDSDGNKTGIGYEYHEVQYDKDEYLRMLINEKSNVE